MITCKLNPRVYNSLLVLLDAVRLYRVYRQLDTLPLYLYYELLAIFTYNSFDTLAIKFFGGFRVGLKPYLIQTMRLTLTPAKTSSNYLYRSTNFYYQAVI